MPACMGDILNKRSPQPTGQDDLCVCTKLGTEELESQISSWSLTHERPAPSQAWGLLFDDISLETSSTKPLPEVLGGFLFQVFH